MQYNISNCKLKYISKKILNTMYVKAKKNQILNLFAENVLKDYFAFASYRYLARKTVSSCCLMVLQTT